MLHGTYHKAGPIVRLRDQTALLQQDPNNDNNYIAQFDLFELKESHGWHSFPKELFVYVGDNNEV